MTNSGPGSRSPAQDEPQSLTRGLLMPQRDGVVFSALLNIPAAIRWASVML
jgi:hypothetical protein